MPRTIDEAIREANAKGIAIHNLFQLPDGSWRACLKVFGATHDLAVNPVYLNYADGDDPAECIDRAISSSDKIKWKDKAEIAVLAMQGMGEPCIATLDPADRPTIKAAREGHWNRPTTKDSPPKPREPEKPKPKRSTLDEVEEMLRRKAPESVEKSRRKTIEDRLEGLL